MVKVTIRSNLRRSLCVHQPFEVLRAIERKDIMFLMEIRDRSFPVCLGCDCCRLRLISARIALVAENGRCNSSTSCYADWAVTQRCCNTLTRGFFTVGKPSG